LKSLLVLILSCFAVLSGFSQLPDNYSGIEGVDISELLNEARQDFESGERDLAFQKFFYCQKYAKNYGFNEVHFLATIELANFYLMTGSPEKSRMEFSKLKVSKDFEPETRCKYYHRLAFFYNQIGIGDSARMFSFNALKIADQYDLIDDQGTIYNELGNIYEKDRMYDSSRFYYDLAGNTFDVASFDYANAFYNRSRTFYHSGDFDSAIVYLKETLEMVDSTDWFSIKAAASHFKAASHYKLG
jgi:tetratricopeptide (TPR) repeat protein